MQLSTDHKLRLRFSPHVRLVRNGPNIHVALPWYELHLREPGAGVSAAFDRLTEGATEDECVDVVRLTEGDMGLFGLYGALHPLDAAGALSRQLEQDGVPLATLIPQAADFQLPTLSETDPTLYRLSRFACLRAIDGRMRLESGLGRACLDVHDPRVLAWIGDMALNRQYDAECGLSMTAVDALFVFLEAAGALAKSENSVSGDSHDDGSAWWEFHDLLFHMRSRRGRNAGPYGGTGHLRHATIPPLVHPRKLRNRIALMRPDLNSLARSDPPFVTVVERRRSLRDYAAEPISCEELAEFLYRAARIERVLPIRETNSRFDRLRPAVHCTNWRFMWW